MRGKEYEYFIHFQHTVAPYVIFSYISLTKYTIDLKKSAEKCEIGEIASNTVREENGN